MTETKMAKTKILIVDDDRTLSDNLRDILLDEGYEVTARYSAISALKLMKKKEFDIAIIDIVMPHINGMELLWEIKKKWPGIQVVMITAFATVENAVEAIKNGAADYIAKPFKTNEIQVVIKRVIEEANFQNRISAIRKTPETERIISSINSSIRRGILLFLKGNRYNFTKIMKGVNVEDPTKLNFHLQKLKTEGLVSQDEEKKYYLTGIGKKALNILIQLEEV